jgi:hypothetical protein
VTVGGLAPLFALFMGKAKVKGPKGDKAGRDVAREMEERSVSLISSLLQVGGRRVESKADGGLPGLCAGAPPASPRRAAPRRAAPRRAPAVALAWAETACGRPAALPASLLSLAPRRPYRLPAVSSTPTRANNHLCPCSLEPSHPNPTGPVSPAPRPAPPPHRST